MSQNDQQDNIPHNLAYLDSLNQGETDGDTDVALNNLFEAGPDDPSHPFGVEQDISLDIDEQGITEGSMKVNDDSTVLPAELANPDSSSIDPALAPDPPVKRKATSRANMLTRGGACEFCKRRKLKCSAETPKCSACLRWNKDCVYGQKKQRSRVKVLEDRLAELEKKLGSEESSSPLPATQAHQQQTQLQAGEIYSGPGFIIPPSYPSDPVNNASGPSGEPFTYSDLGMDLDPSLDLGFSLDILEKEAEEPDLMTLADAATHGRPEAGGKYPWAGMDSAQIVSTILKTVQGETMLGMGSKIVPFLIQAYSYPRIPQNMLLFETATLLPRLAPGASSPLHPSLTLSIIYLVLSFLPPSVFPGPGAANAIGTAILGPAREYAYQAYASSDPRMVDVVAGQVIRAMAIMYNGRTIEAYAEGSGAPAMADACGLTKRNGLSTDDGGNDVIKSQKRHTTLSTHQGGTPLVPRPGDKAGSEQRQRAFWSMYIFDKCAAIAQGWPSGYTDEDITTTWPSETGDNTESMREFLSIQSPTGKVDSTFCSTAKTVTLLHCALRLFDETDDTLVSDRAQKLLRLCNAYLPSLSPVLHRPSGEWGIQQGPANSNLMTLHIALALIHTRQSLCSEKRPDDALSLSIQSLRKVGESIDLARELGDFAFEGYDMVSATAWLVAGRTAYLTAERLKHTTRGTTSPDELLRAEEVRSVGDKITEALKIMGKRTGYAIALSKILEREK